ncbi:MAG: hypothetical protein AAB370_04695 [Verrucomicrobiota bacterium]
MEIKVQCDCGQKFKFDVEPVNGRMPFTVNCPVCGADGTPRANVLLQQLLPPSPVSTAYAPPPPLAAPAPAPAPMRPAGLSVNRPQPVQPASAPPEPIAAGAAAAEDDSESEGGVRVIQLGWKGWAVILLLIGLVAGGSYLKSAQRSLVRDTLDWVWEKVTGESETESGEEMADAILFSQGEASLLFKHDNQQEIAAACAEFWSAQYNQKLYLLGPTNSLPVEAAYSMDANSVAVVLPAQNGTIQLVAPYEVNDKLRAALTALAESVSRKLHCTNICAFMGEGLSTGTVIVYDNGTPRFRCDRSLTTIGSLEKVKVEGEDWVKGIGFKPGKAGFKGFTMEDAEALTKYLGFQSASWDAPVPCIILSTKLENP